MVNQKALKSLIWILAVVFLSSVWSKNNSRDSASDINYLPRTDGQTKFNLHAIPGLIQVEDYDKGGLATAYSDSTSGNLGGAYRSDNVDVQTTSDIGGGYNLGWIEKGEWLEYTIDSVSSGIYDIYLRVAAVTDNRKSITLQLDGENLGIASFYGTNGWQNWTTIKIGNVNVQAGENKVLRLNMTSGGFNMNWIEFVPTDSVLLSSQPNHISSGSVSSLESSDGSSGLSCSFNIESEWKNGFIARVDVCNNGRVSKNKWTASWRFNDESRMTNGWSSNFSGDNPYTATPLSWNSALHPNQCVSFGFQGSKNGLYVPSTNISCN